jgi:actin-related protein
MTESSLTLSEGNEKFLRESRKYREKLVKKAFEELKVAQFALVPPQLPMLMSEMVLDGVVVDIGHEVTQIVPFVDGRACYHKAAAFPAAGMFVDHILA